MRTFHNFMPAFILALSMCMALPVLAHGEVPRLEISVERINPGGVIEVRGVDFEFEEQISLILTGSDVEIALGEMTVDTEGKFLQFVTLPVDLKEGTYQFRAVADDHVVFSPVLLVQGAPLAVEEGEGGRRDEEEPLLAPVPTYAPGVIPGVAPVETQTVSSNVKDPGRNIPLIAIITIFVLMSAEFIIVKMGKRA